MAMGQPQTPAVICPERANSFLRVVHYSFPAKIDMLRIPRKPPPSNSRLQLRKFRPNEEQPPAAMSYLAFQDSATATKDFGGQKAARGRGHRRCYAAAQNSTLHCWMAEARGSSEVLWHVLCHLSQCSQGRSHFSSCDLRPEAFLSGLTPQRGGSLTLVGRKTPVTDLLFPA